MADEIVTQPEMATPSDTVAPPLLMPSLVGIAAMMSIIGSLGAPLIPTIAAANHVTLSAAGWILTGTLLTGALATPVMGRLADGPHQRRVLLVALAIVFLGSVLAAVSQNFDELVVGRGLQGLGLGLLPVTMAVARSNLPSSQAARTIAMLSITAAVGVGLGYPLTSLIAEKFDYHAAFWFGAIMIGLAFAVVWFVIPKNPNNPSHPFDFVGAITIDVAVVALLVLLAEGEVWGWTSPKSLILLIGGIVVLVSWAFHQLHVSDPIVNLRQLRIRPVLTADISGFLISMAMYLFIPVVVEFVQIPKSSGYGFGSSILVSGFLLVPLSVGTFLASRFLRMFSRNFGNRAMIPFGAVAFAVAAGFFALFHAALWQAFVAVGLAGIGAGFTFAAMPGFIVRSVPAEETGSATGFYQVVRSIGLSTGSAVATAILAIYTLKGSALPKVEGFSVALYLASALCLLTAVLSFFVPGPTSPLSPHEEREIEDVMEENAELGGSGFSLSQEIIENL